MLPILDKTWVFTHINKSVGTLASADADAKAFIYQLMVSLLANGWTIRSSSDGVNAGNNDDAQHIGSAAEVVFAAGDHSWFVLQNAALDAGGAAALLIDCREPFGGGTKSWEAIFSIEGFDNSGTKAVAPAAIAAGTSWTILSGAMYPLSSAFAGRLHVISSTDGECTRVFYTDASSSTTNIPVLFIDKAKSPCTEWVDPVYTIGYTWLAALQPSAATLSAVASRTLSKVSGTAITLHLTGEGIGLGGMITECATLPVADDASAAWPFLPMGLACPTVGHRNWRKGQVYDMWWGSYQVATGDTYPAVSPLRKFVQIGTIVLPWDGQNIPDGTAILLDL